MPHSATWAIFPRWGVIAAGMSISSRFMIVMISSGDIVSRFIVSGFRCSVVRTVRDGSMGDSFRFVCGQYCETAGG